MSEVIWKCYRCNLSFKDEGVAEKHKQISSHSVSKVYTIVILLVNFSISNF